MKKCKVLLILALLLCPFFSCEKDYIKEDTKTTGENNQGDDDTGDGINEDSNDYILDSSGVINIMLNGSSISADTDSVVIISGSVATITGAGTYYINGSLSDGQIIVNSTAEEDIKLVFNNINITCLTSAPLYIMKAEKVIVYLPENTENYLTDGASYQGVTDNEPNAALYSKSDLSIYGNGSLAVTGNYNDGISSKDGLIIKSGTISVTSADDGIRGKDFLYICNGNITVNSGGDGMISDNDADASLGFVSIDSGTFNLTSTGDAISAQTVVEVSDGEFNIVSGGGSSNSAYVASSAKGIKGLTKVIINSGIININSSDDALHSNAAIEINGGTINASSADDGIHADKSIALKDCNFYLSKSYEGIESASITIDNSNVSIVSSDDGFNATQGSAVESNDNSCLTINSGFISVNASGGDALDANGNIVITGGTVVAHGPSSNPEVGLDFNGTCKISGGKVMISGPSSNMLQAPSSSSTQNSVVVQLSSTKSANTIFRISDSEGNDVVTFAPLRNYQSVILSSPDFVTGNTYTIYTGGTCTGTETDGLYIGGTYSGGTTYTTFTISSVITTVGSSTSTSPGGSKPGR